MEIPHLMGGLKKWGTQPLKAEGEKAIPGDTLKLSDLPRSCWEVPGQRISLPGFSQDLPLKYVKNGKPHPQKWSWDWHCFFWQVHPIFTSQLNVSSLTTLGSWTWGGKCIFPRQSPIFLSHSNFSYGVCWPLCTKSPKQPPSLVGRPELSQPPQLLLVFGGLSPTGTNAWACVFLCSLKFSNSFFSLGNSFLNSPPKVSISHPRFFTSFPGHPHPQQRTQHIYIPVHFGSFAPSQTGRRGFRIHVGIVEWGDRCHEPAFCKQTANEAWGGINPVILPQWGKPSLRIWKRKSWTHPIRGKGWIVRANISFVCDG